MSCGSGERLIKLGDIWFSRNIFRYSLACFVAGVEHLGRGGPTRLLTSDKLRRPWTSAGVRECGINFISRGKQADRQLRSLNNGYGLKDVAAQTTRMLA